MKDIILLGGPNGAGKTTAAKVLLPQRLPIEAFVNADEIVRRLSPGDGGTAALQAGRLMLTQMQELVRTGRSFAFETTCAAKTYARMLRECQAVGWRVSLLYLWVPSAEYAIARVARRVSQGGHFVPDEVVRRRYRAGLWNLRHLYLPLADDATIYDNSDNALRLIARRSPGSPLTVVDGEIWAGIEEETRWAR